MQSYSLVGYFQLEAVFSSHPFLNTYTNTFPLQAFISGVTLPFSIKINQVNRQRETYREERKKKCKQAEPRSAPSFHSHLLSHINIFAGTKNDHNGFNRLNLTSDYNDTEFAVWT